MDKSVDRREMHAQQLESLIHLYELRDRVEAVIRARGVRNPRSEAERHWFDHGHLLTHGCCARRST